MIAGTNTNCKVLSITITDSTATVKLLFSANIPTSPSKGFKIYLQDKPTLEISKPQLIDINNNIYWVDTYNYATTSLNNISINKYKEVDLYIDITNNNQSKIKENRWVRECYIRLVDIDSPEQKISWSSELLTLISDVLILPKLKTFSHYEIKQEDTYKPVIIFELQYESEIDYNYSNSNFYYIINIYDVSSNNLLETKEQTEDYLPIYKEIEFDEEYYDLPILVELIIKNKANDTVLRTSRIFTPSKKFSNTFVKTKDGIKKCLAYYTNGESFATKLIQGTPKITIPTLEINEEDDEPKLEIKVNGSIKVKYTFNTWIEESSTLEETIFNYNVSAEIIEYTGEANKDNTLLKLNSGPYKNKKVEYSGIEKDSFNQIELTFKILYNNAIIKTEEFVLTTSDVFDNMSISKSYSFN